MNSYTLKEHFPRPDRHIKEKTFIGQPTPLKIESRIEIGQGIYVITLQGSLGQVIPGQSCMIWVPEFDERPFTIAYSSATHVQLVIEKKGTFTDHLTSNMYPYENFWVRGPYGNGFRRPKTPAAHITILIDNIAGLASLTMLRDTLKSEHSITIKVNQKLSALFRNEIFHNIIPHFESYTSLPTAVQESSLYSYCYFSISDATQLSLLIDIIQTKRASGELVSAQAMVTDSTFGCSMGLCGQCELKNIPNGLLVCSDGPVFDLTHF